MANDGSWFPIIISEKCDGCSKIGKPRCVEFCSNGVFEFREGKSIVAHPAACGGEGFIFHCSACAPICHKKAIVFPSTNMSYSQADEEGKDMIRKTKCVACGKEYWTNREIDVCFDCEAKK